MKYYTSRYGGLHSIKTGEFINHADLAKEAATLGIKPSELHGRLLISAKANQLKEQSRRTSTEILESINKTISGFDMETTLGHHNTRAKFLNAIIDAFDKNRILVSSNTYRSFLMPCSDPASISSEPRITTIFRKFIKSAGVHFLDSDEHAESLYFKFVTEIQIR